MVQIHSVALLAMNKPSNADILFSKNEKPSALTTFTKDESSYS